MSLTQFYSGLYIILSGSVALSAASTSTQLSQDFDFDSPNEYEWLTVGDHFGEAALLSAVRTLGEGIKNQVRKKINCAHTLGGYNGCGRHVFIGRSCALLVDQGERLFLQFYPLISFVSTHKGANA